MNNIIGNLWYFKNEEEYNNFKNDVAPEGCDLQILTTKKLAFYPCVVAIEHYNDDDIASYTISEIYSPTNFQEMIDDFFWWKK